MLQLTQYAYKQLLRKPINPKIGQYVRNVGGSAYVKEVLSDNMVYVGIYGMWLKCRVTRDVFGDLSAY